MAYLEVGACTAAIRNYPACQTDWTDTRRGSHEAGEFASLESLKSHLRDHMSEAELILPRWRNCHADRREHEATGMNENEAARKPAAASPRKRGWNWKQDGQEGGFGEVIYLKQAKIGKGKSKNRGGNLPKGSWQ